MATISDFSGPAPDVFINVCALNAAYLDASSDMKGPQKGRLAAAPFLLFSLRETDVQWWGDALQQELQFGLLDESSRLKNDLYAVQTAAVSFLWQLARNNPYVARIVSGASIAWCEMLIEWPLVTILDRVGQRGDLLHQRMDLTDDGERRMLTTGAGSSSVARRAAHIAELQALLTNGSKLALPRLAAAACSMPTVALSVAETQAGDPTAKKL